MCVCVCGGGGEREGKLRDVSKDSHITGNKIKLRSFSVLSPCSTIVIQIYFEFRFSKTKNNST